MSNVPFFRHSEMFLCHFLGLFTWGHFIAARLQPTSPEVIL
ncbi:hypothetical protein CES86_0399 [Brucella lupini]|uniref:Uncharacterized protein n=1 Tax=Brucella lupini TaxID=255457 RepID=A0A256GXU6_9HYPH|nr:hypothetical protein CES86_0399 [Brucella lupini]